jgi:hypothetical protein
MGGMSTSRPNGSAISRLVAGYKANLEKMPLSELESAYCRLEVREPHETQFVCFSAGPSREWLINELVGKRELELEQMMPLEIDDLFDQVPD